MTTTKNNRYQLPLVALRQLVIFPGVTLPIVAGRPKTLKAIERAVNDSENNPEKLIFAVLQREENDDIHPSNLHTIGTIASIEQLQRGLGGAQLLVSGRSRGIALRVDDVDGYYMATVSEAEELMPSDPNDLAFIALEKEARQRSAELAEKTGLPREVTQQVLRSVEHPGRFTDLVAGYLDLSADERQKLLETLSIEERLRRVLTLIGKQLGVMAAQEDIKSQVQEELGDRQREMYLREQLKAIQKELGEGEGGEDLEELRQRLESLELPADARKEVDRELRRLERMGPQVMESQVIRNFLETVAELPWNERSDDRLDLPLAARVLDEDHYGLEEIKDRILEFLAVRQMREQRRRELETSDAEAASAGTSAEGEAAEASDGDEPLVEIPSHVTEALTRARERGRSPILLFVGPPGVGKTSLAKSIARAMGREYVRVSLGGVRDEADIRGHRRTYVGAMPGRIVKGMKQAGTRNPVFLLDEVDKLGASYQGDPAAALLEVLDPAQNDTFTDHYLGIPFDLSEVFFVATANFLQGIPEPLLDRMEKIDFAGYTEKEKLEIAKRYLVPRQIEEGGLSPERVEIADEGILSLIQNYTREAGVRQLEREIGRVVRKVARQLAEGDAKSAAEAEKVTVDAAKVRELLGRERVHPERAAEIDQIGIATGMFYTPVGGDIMFVEASTMKGKGNLTLTGQLGEVMKESAQAAWTYARAHADALGIPAERFERDVHVHVPAGAVPKEGPSAGISMATALVSALSNRPVRHDLAMTGEITLSGRVLPIGGVKEKVLGAVRAGITHVILPRQNEKDLEDLPREVRDQLEVTFAETLGDVLAVALRDASYENGRLLFKNGEGAHAPASPN